MNKPLLIVALTTLASLSTPARADETPSAEQILQAVRASTTQTEELTLEGKLRVLGGKRHAFRMTVRRAQIAFLFEAAPQHTIVLDLGAEQFQLRERLGTKGSFAEVPEAKYGEALRGTGVNYLDISLAYLYWPNPKFLQEDVVAERLTWKLRVPNPSSQAPYAWLDLWIDQNTGGLMRMQGYDARGQLVKKMEVKEVQKVQSGTQRVWTLEKMTVTAYDPKTRRPISRTYMEL